MSPALLQTFVAGCIGLVVLVAAFFGAQWATGLKSSVDALNTTIKELTSALAESNAKQAVHEDRIERHGEEIDALKRAACKNPDCPYRGDRWPR